MQANTEDEIHQKMIEEFKSETPPNILKQFKNDDDILDYLIGRGEWEIIEPGKKININADSKEEAANKIISNLRKAFGDDVNINIVDNAKEE